MNQKRSIMKTNNTKTDNVKSGTTKTGSAKTTDSVKAPNVKTGNSKMSDSYGNDSRWNDSKSGSPKKDVSCGEDFHDFFVDQIKDIYWAEKHLKKGLEKMRRSATSPKLAAAFEKHYGDGDKQIAVLEEIFALLGEKPETKRCEAMAGLLEEADGMVTDTKRNSFVRDAGLILAAQKVEHYEIATYGTLCALAEYLPEKKIKRLIERTLAEEKKTDQLLTKLAEDFVNEYAAVE